MSYHRENLIIPVTLQFAIEAPSSLEDQPELQTTTAEEQARQRQEKKARAAQEKKEKE